MYPKKIFVAGLTAAGKTTHSKLLASEFALSYVSASSFLLEGYELKPDVVPTSFWVSPYAHELEARRHNDPSIDQWVDQQMVKAATELESAVFDTWGLPWMTSAPGIRIWLESSLESRLWKAKISHGDDSLITDEELQMRVKEKDMFSRDYFWSAYKFDIFTDHNVFDFVIDISKFIKAPTVEASRRSITETQKIISSLVKGVFSAPKAIDSVVQTLMSEFGKDIFPTIDI